MSARLFAAAMLLAVTATACAAEFSTLDGAPFERAELGQGRLAILFVIAPGCSACEEATRWLADSAAAVEDVRPLVVAPEGTPELHALAREIPGVTVIVDENWALGGPLDIWTVPTLLTAQDGIIHDIRDGPFDSVEALDALLELSASQGSPSVLEGAAPPEFTGRDASGAEIHSSELPLPHILMFFSVGCPGCWDMAEASVQVTELAEVVLLVAPGQLTEEHWARLEQIFAEAPGPWRVLEIDGAVRSAYRVRGTPTSFILDARGIVGAVVVGPMRPSFWYEEVREVVGEGAR